MYENFEIDAVVMLRTERFFEIARQVDALIKDLDLPQPSNDALIELIVQQVQEAESGAFCQALIMAGAIDAE